MREDCIPAPTSEMWESIASGFGNRANFPHSIGAVDGKHIRLTCPFNSGSMYFNYKEYNSIVLMAVADSKYRFMYVHLGSYGKDCDSSIFKRSNFQSIENKEQQLLEEKPLPGTESPNIPYFFVGDAAFGLHKHLLRSFGGTHLTIDKRIFNYRPYRARIYVECSFGILTNKWRIFHRPINVQPEYAVIIINACIILHNFVLGRDGYGDVDTTYISGLADLPQETNIRAANNVRSVFSKYFVPDIGSIPWQMSKI